MKKTTLALAVAAGAALATPAFAEDSVTVTTGLDWSKGDYGTGSDTEILIAPLSLRYKTGDLRFTATLSWLRIDGASGIVGDGSGGVVIDPNAPRTVRSGFGDVNLGAAWAIPEEKLGFGLEFNGRVKLPTAKASRGLVSGYGMVAYGHGLSSSALVLETAR